MKSTPRTFLSFGILGFALAISSCSSEAESAQGSAPAPATSTFLAAPTVASSDATVPTPVGPTSPSASASADSALVGGDGEVEIRTYAGTYVAPSVEGGVITVDDPSTAEVPAQWLISRVEAGGGTYQLRTVALTDGQASCLALAADADVALASCDGSDPAQNFSVTSLDRPEQVALSTTAGYLGVDTGDGTLEVFPSGDQLSSTFTLIEG